jgi:Fe-S cluster assembly protein SufD
MSNTPKIVTKKMPFQHRRQIEEFRFSLEEIPQLNSVRLQQYHQSAWSAFQSLPFPTLRDEPWRRTDIRDLQTGEFSLSNGSRNILPPPSRLLEPILFGEERGGQIISGAIEKNVSLNPKLKQKGVIFTDFHSAELEYPDLMERILGQIVFPNEDKFTALAAALARDGVVLYIPKDVVVREPIHSLYWGGAKIGRTSIISLFG